MTGPEIACLILLAVVVDFLVVVCVLAVMRGGHGGRRRATQVRPTTLWRDTRGQR